MGFKDIVKRSISFTGYRVVRREYHPDAYETQAFLLRSAPVRIIMDLGANVGQTYRRYRSLFPSAVIHSFEPFPDSYNQLVAVVSGDSQSFAHRFAVADEVGKRALFVSKGSQMNSLLEIGPDGPTHMGGDQSTVVARSEVDVVTVDDFCKRQEIAIVDILKMDVQGGEMAVLRGAEEMLQSRRIRLIFTEVLFAEMYRHVPQFDALWRYIEGQGYALHGIYNLTPGTNGRVGYGDAIFTPR